MKALSDLREWRYNLDILNYEVNIYYTYSYSTEAAVQPLS
jgi:hypothetical protein